MKGVGNKEDIVCGTLGGFVGNFFASLALFLILGTAYLRRDGNQALKGIINAGVTYAGVGVSVGTGGVAAIPAFIAVTVCLIMIPTFIDWCVPGRSDEHYADPCCSVCSCCPFFGRVKVDEDPLAAAE